MKTIEMIIDDLNNCTEVFGEVTDIQNYIIESFGDYEFDGETEVITSYDDKSTIQAYVDHIAAPVVIVNIEFNKNYGCGISSAYVY